MSWWCGSGSPPPGAHFVILDAPAAYVLHSHAGQNPAHRWLCGLCPPRLSENLRQNICALALEMAIAV